MKKLFSNPNTILKWCFWFTIAFIFLYDFWFVFIPEQIPGGHKFGIIFYKICFAFITSYIFYYLNVYLKKKADKKNISPYLAKKTHYIIQRAKNLFAEIGKAAEVEFQTPFPPEEAFMEACKKVDPNGNAPMVGTNLKHLNWIQYLYNQHIEVSNAILNLFALMPHLESNHIKLLNDIEESVFFKTIGIQVSVPFRNKDLTAWAKELLKYGALIKNLEQY